MHQQFLMNKIRFSLALLVAAACTAGAQRPDSSRTLIAPAALPRDTLAPPISPRRAFLYSFLLPGYSQSVLGRHKTASGFLIVEGVSLAMIRESAADLHEARRFQNDSIVVSYSNGVPAKIPGTFSNKEVKTRQAHVEDWLALLVANHLFAGADAFVAAHLWDVPAKLALRSTPNGTMLAASIDIP
jgi:hypothetical protein